MFGQCESVKYAIIMSQCYSNMCLLVQDGSGCGAKQHMTLWSELSPGVFQGYRVRERRLMNQ